jgi:hypothetical protein
VGFLQIICSLRPYWKHRSSFASRLAGSREHTPVRGKVGTAARGVRIRGHGQRARRRRTAASSGEDLRALQTRHECTTCRRRDWVQQLGRNAADDAIVSIRRLLCTHLLSGWFEGTVSLCHAAPRYVPLQRTAYPVTPDLGLEEIL